jgi:6-phosphogluconolactonase
LKPEIRYFSGLEVLSLEAAHFISQTANKCVAEKGFFTLVLSGGNTPHRLYELLSQGPFARDLPWPYTHFFWGDERCVPADHPDSNYGLAYRSLLSKIPLPETNVHRIPAEMGTGPEMALEYEKEIWTFFQQPDRKKNLVNPDIKIKAIPSFDLILLGVGKDGHTASLFPGDPALREKEHLTAYVPKPGLAPEFPRITMTLPLINQADAVLFLVSGAEKKEVIEAILHEPDAGRYRYPAAQVNPKGKIFWFIC